MDFAEMGLHLRIVRAVRRLGYSVATPIQRAAIPLIVAGHDVLGCAQTGTGKTAAFALPTLHHLLPAKLPNHRRGRQRQRAIRALVLTPTRELAGQIETSFANYGRCTDLRQTVIYGGVSQNRQVEALQAGTDIVIATPGRLLDLLNQGHVSLKEVTILVLDEADQMLNMGFINDVTKIVQQVPAQRQTLMFSATMPAAIEQLASQWLDDPRTVQVNPVASTPEKIDQSVAFVEESQKGAALVRFLQTVSGERHLVFCRTKQNVDRVVRHLMQAEVPALALHGDKRQGTRERALARFSLPRPPVLVATDVAARGLHMPEVSHVFNYDLPATPEVYVHRIGRTARAGAVGASISLCSGDDRPYLAQIEKLIQQKVTVRELPPCQQDDAGLPIKPSAASRTQTSKRARGGAPRRGKKTPRRTGKSERPPAGGKRRGKSSRRK